jgi:F0F1-type ATP synthase assembly protein I
MSDSASTRREERSILLRVFAVSALIVDLVRRACDVAIPNPRSAFAIGTAWASRVTAIALTFVVPPMAGYGVDRVARTMPFGTLVGAIAGFGLGIYRVLDLAKQANRSIKQSPNRRQP